MNDDRFTNAIHQLCSALHWERIDPQKVTIELPHDEWWKLWCSLERKFSGFMKFDGRGGEPNQFQYMGIFFKCKAPTVR